MRTIICIAGFGDDASMYDPLITSSDSASIRFHAVSLPGFGAPSLSQPPTSLSKLADWLVETAREARSDTVLAHSVASIIASLAATRPGSPITRILSLEGNLTAADAYFSGTAAQYESAAAFRTAFLARLDEMADGDPIMARYCSVVEYADADALWELGCDAHAFSAATVPGEVLLKADSAAYFYNRENVPESSLAWLDKKPLPSFPLPEASHWASIDQPGLLVEQVQAAMRLLDEQS